MEEPVAGDEVVAREMGKLAGQLSLVPSLTALFLCLAVRGWGGGLASLLCWLCYP